MLDKQPLTSGISLPILPQPPASWLWLCRHAQSVHNFKTQGHFTVHCWPRRHRSVYAGGLGWRQEQGDGLRSFHAFFSFSFFFFLLKIYILLLKSFRSKYIIFPKFLEKKVKKKKKKKLLSLCKDLQIILIIWLWVSHQLNQDDSQPEMISEETGKQPGTPLLTLPSIISLDDKPFFSNPVSLGDLRQRFPFTFCQIWTVDPRQ